MMQRMSALVNALRRTRNDRIAEELAIRTYGRSTADPITEDLVHEVMHQLSPKAKIDHVAAAVAAAELATREAEYAEFSKVFVEELEIMQARELIERGLP